MPTRVVVDQDIEHERDGEAGGDDDEPPDRIEQAGHQRDRAGQRVRDRQLQRRRAPDDLHALVEEQDDAEGGDHLVEMVAVVEMAEDREFEQQPEGERGEQAPSTRAARKLPVRP